MPRYEGEAANGARCGHRHKKQWLASMCERVDVVMVWEIIGEGPRALERLCERATPTKGDE